MRVFRVAGKTTACSRLTGRRYALGDFGAAPGVGDFALVRHVALAGSYLAYELVSDGRSGPSDVVLVRRAASGRIRRQVSANEERSEAWDFTPDKGISDLVLRRDGSVAWVVKSLFGQPLRREVHKVDAGGHVLLDFDANATEIQAGSLALSSSFVYWMHGDQPRSAPLGWRGGESVRAVRSR